MQFFYKQFIQYIHESFGENKHVEESSLNHTYMHANDWCRMLTISAGSCCGRPVKINKNIATVMKLEAKVATERVGESGNGNHWNLGEFSRTHSSLCKEEHLVLMGVQVTTS